MASTTSRGNRYKVKTKQWFIDRGYVCEYTEKLQAIFTPKGVIYQKSDLWGSDGVAMNGKEIIFWNSKSTLQEKKGIGIEKARGSTEFRKYPYPTFVKLQLFIWEPRKEPIIVEVNH